MFELVVSLCLSAAPWDCRVETAGSYETEAACQAAGREVRGAEAETRQAWTCPEDGQVEGFWISEVSPGVYVHKGQQAEPGPENAADTANLGFVIGRDAVAVIDAGGSDTVANALLAEIRRRTDLPVTYLILTHMHPDHVLGAGVFAAEGAAVIAHPALPAGLAARHAHYHAAYMREMGQGWAASESFPPVTSAPDMLDLGGRVLELRRHPTGHTANDLSVFDVATSTWFLGDLVFLDHMPSIDGSLRGWMAALDEAQMRIAARVVPGHGPVSTDWPAAAVPTYDYLTTLAQQVRSALDQGMELLDAVTEIGGNPPSGWLLSETFHPRNVTSAFRELEWE